MANLHRAFAPHIPGKVAFKQVDKTATVDASIAFTLAGVGKNLEHCMLDETIVFTLTAVAEVFPLKATLDAPIAITLASAVDVIKTATLDATIPFTLAGQTKYGSNATLDATIPLTLAAIGKIPLDGTLNRQLSEITNMSLAGAGTVPSKGTLAETLQLTLAGQAILNNASLDASVFTLTLASTTTQLSRLLGIATMPAFTGDAILEGPANNSVTFPAFTGISTSHGENIFVGIGIMPAFTGQATTGHSSNTLLPSFTGSAVVANGNTYISMTTLPPLIGDAVLEPDLGARSDTLLPSFTGTSEVVSVSGATSVVNLPAFTADSVALAGVEHIGVATLPSLIGDAVLQSGQFIISVTTLPAFTGSAITSNGIPLVHTTHVFNTENMAATEYSNYDFLAMAMFNGIPVGIGATGVFELSGSDDDGVDIDIDVLSGFSNLGTEDLKRMSNVYLGYKSAGDIQVQVTIAGEPAVRTYTVAKISNTSEIKRGRATPGHGLNSRYWQVGVKNVLGSDLELDDLDLYVEQFNRKVQ